MARVGLLPVTFAVLAVATAAFAQPGHNPHYGAGHAQPGGQQHPHGGGGGGGGAAVETEPEMQPPIEVESVWGCSDDSQPRATTAGCNEGDSITIRGRYFGRSGVRVLLIAETPGVPTATSGEAIECPQPRHSGLLPSLLAFCTLPQVPKQSATTYHVRVVARNGISAVKRAAVTYAVPEDDGEKAGGDGSTRKGGAKKGDSAIRLLDPSRWAELGIGGLGPQFKDLFRRAFGSRLGVVSPIVEKVGMRHVKGVIFHGLPGTGKTLVARKVAEALGSKHVRVVNGPEIMSKFVGDSERNLRDLFSDADAAWAEHGSKSSLYVIVIDEIDAIMRSRGSSKGDDSAARAVYDGVTTQMLSYMDGMKTGNNLLIIGLTNRLDSLDPALLRPGRFEVQIRFPLPDRDGRKQILDIHTSTLREHKFLGADVALDDLVDATASFSGADLAATVRSATSFAMARVYESQPPDSEQAASVDDAELAIQFRVTTADLKRGMREVLAAKTAASNTEPYLKHGFVTFHERVGDTLARLQKLAEDVKNGAAQSMVRVLIEGPPESGLTATAAAAARLARFPHVHVFSPDAMIGLTADEKVERLRQAFDAASQAPAACIILDSIEHLLEYNAVQGRVTTGIQIELAALLRRKLQISSRQGNSGKSSSSSAAGGDELDGRVMVIATSSVAEAVRTLGGGVPLFDAVEVVQPMTRRDAAVVLSAYDVEGEAIEHQQLVAQLPPAIPVKRLVFWLSLAAARTRGSSSVLRPVAGHSQTLDVFAGAHDDESDSDGASKKPIPLGTLTEVLSEFGVIEEAYQGDRLSEVIQW